MAVINSALPPPTSTVRPSKLPSPFSSFLFVLAVAFTAYYVFFSTHDEKKLVFWVKHPRHTDAVKVLVPYDADVADTKKVVKSELAPAIDKESLGQVLLLSTRAGRLSPDTKIRRLAGREKTLIVFVDNVESRLYLKTLTADQVPIQVNNPLCLKSNEAYIAVTRILTGDYAQQDINILKKSLCESSIESWSSRYSYNFREGKKFLTTDW